MSLFSDIFTPQVTFFGYRFFVGTKPAWQAALQAWLAQPFQKTLFVATPNPEQLILANQEPAFHQLLQAADLCIPDGAGLLWASRWLQWRKKIPPISTRLTGIDTLEFLLQLQPSPKIALIGGFTPPTDNRIVWSSGYLKVKQPTPAEEIQLKELLTSSKPSVVCVAFGAPDQEYWIFKHLPLLQELGVKLVLPVGGAGDVLFGKLRRAPRWIQAIHLEWAYRLWQEPWRWKRQLRLWRFFPLVLSQTEFSFSKNTRQFTD